MVEATVLVVDDDERFRAFVRGALGPPRFRVVEAVDARSAVERALEERPAVILLHGQRPDGRVIVSCRQLRTHPALAGTRIAMVAELDDDGDRHAVDRAGADALVLKDDNPDALAFQVRRLLAPGVARATG